MAKLTAFRILLVVSNKLGMPIHQMDVRSAFLYGDILYCDNQSAIRIAYNSENNKRLKHIDIKFAFIKEKLENKVIEIKYISTEKQMADMFTKPLGKCKFERFRENLGVVPNN